MDIIEQARKLLELERAAGQVQARNEGKVTVVLDNRIVEVPMDHAEQGEVASREMCTDAFMAEVRRLGELAQIEYDKKVAATSNQRSQSRP
jgi:hypothetical protein